ncbi:hypothetical protein [Microlunatus sp. GCM10028923]|uniref:hypothetical protein n=1 Tax=Microlunatus sp. GCM10028923 TaxID=3273400 RepID=UPI00360A7EC6
MSSPAPSSPARSGRDHWAQQLAPRLVAPPARWGWEAAPVPDVPPAPADLAPRPTWVEPPRPDQTALRDARSAAVTRVFWRGACILVLLAAFSTYRFVIEEQADEFGAGAVLDVAFLAAAGLLALWVLRAVAGLWYAVRNLRNFERPYLIMRDEERARHDQALQRWSIAQRQHAQSAAAVAQDAARRAGGALWFPVRPAGQPTRVDVFGGDPHRHGWASLLVTLGGSMLAAGHRITLLDLTGSDVGGGLLEIARVAGRTTRTVAFDDVLRPPPCAALSGLSREQIADRLGRVLTGGEEDRQEECRVITDVLRAVLDCLDGAPTFGRLAAGIRVLRKGRADDLSDVEVTRLVERIGDIDQDDWTSRLLRHAASQLDLLHRFIPVDASGFPLWSRDSVSVLATDGRRDDLHRPIEELLIQLVEQEIDRGGLDGVLVVAGADHLGERTLRSLSDRARRGGVPLVQLIEQPQGHWETSLGSGGAVLIMKLYNHREANLAAEFIGKGHRFVVNQVTRQVGTTLTEGGGDSFAANTSQASGRKQSRSGVPGRRQNLSDTRGHAWTGTRNWTMADNLGTSTSTSRVYEFAVEPTEILDLPETAFILVDNTGPARQVTFADSNPGICMLDRVSDTPLTKDRS